MRRQGSGGGAFGGVGRRQAAGGQAAGGQAGRRRKSRVATASRRGVRGRGARQAAGGRREREAGDRKHHPRPRYAQSGRMPLLRVIMTTYDPVSENLAATEPGTGGEAEGNCVAARRGGKQPEAKEQSQRQLNSIRCEFAASLRGTGEACGKSNPSSRHRPANARDGANWHGWSENAPKEVCVSGESCADRHRARSARTVQQSEPPYERGSPVTRMEQREAGK
jgi:hypothetical protein